MQTHAHSHTRVDARSSSVDWRRQRRRRRRLALRGDLLSSLLSLCCGMARVVCIASHYYTCAAAKRCLCGKSCPIKCRAHTHTHTQQSRRWHVRKHRTKGRTLPPLTPTRPLVFDRICILIDRNVSGRTRARANLARNAHVTHARAHTHARARLPRCDMCIWRGFIISAGVVCDDKHSSSAQQKQIAVVMVFARSHTLATGARASEQNGAASGAPQYTYMLLRAREHMVWR